MIKKYDINYRILVNMNKLFDIKKTLNDELNNLVNKNYIEEYGYLTKIEKINKHNVKDISRNDFKSNIFIDVNFTGEFINPDIGSVIECVITDNNNITIGISNNIIKCIIIDNNSKVKVGDIVNVKVLAKQIKLNDSFINIVGSIIKD